MNPILLFLIILFGSIFGSRNQPQSLQKKSDINYFSKIMDGIEAWCIRHASFCLILLGIILAVLFVFLCYALVGVSAVESGVHYNHFQDVI